MKKALSLGAKAPLIASFGSEKFPHAHLATLLGALEQTYVVRKSEEHQMLLDWSVLAVANTRR